jgi:hypothetical protein
MDNAELLSQFQAKVDEFARYQEFIDKAEAQSSRFAAAVVEKVIASNREKSLGVVEQLIPLTADVEDVIAAIESEKAEIASAHEVSHMAIQELELRMAIGELDQEGFDAESADLRKDLDEAGAKVEELDNDLSSFRAALEQWTELGTRGGVLSAAPDEAESDEDDDESDLMADEVDDDDVGLALGDDDLELGGEDLIEDDFMVDEIIVGDSDDIVEIEVDGGDDVQMDEVDADNDDIGVHAERLTVQDDVSSVFVDEPEDAVSGGASVAVAIGGADDEDYEDDDSSADDEVLLSDDVLPADDGDLDILSGDEALELDSADSGQDLKPRRAVLLYAEGTPEEQVHPVTKDVVSIGRGRDNDIQVRNDSKVSRYHCKIYRRGPNYYIEDNKSANGSLVNGELITERRLFGGEEIIIGETFFRFRILD